LGFFRESEVSPDFVPFAIYRRVLGFVPNVAREQTGLPRLVQAEAKLEGAILYEEGVLGRRRKEALFLLLTASRGDSYSVALHSRISKQLGLEESEITAAIEGRDASPSGAGSGKDANLAEFCLKLCHWGPWIQGSDFEKLVASGWSEGEIHEAVLVTGMASYSHALASGLGSEHDFDAPPLSKRRAAPPSPKIPLRAHAKREGLSYLRSVYRSPNTFAPFELIQRTHGYVPNFFRAQSVREDLLGPEAEAIVGILLPEDTLNRRQKELILLAVSAANLNSYCVAVHCNLLRGLGISPDDGDQIAVDYRQANLPAAECALLDFCVKISAKPSEVNREDVERLLSLGFSEVQVIDAIATTALNNFANTVQMGLGIETDFEPPRAFEKKKLHLVDAETRPTESSAASPAEAGSGAEDLGARLVGEAQSGSLDAFEALVRQHSTLVYRTLMAILGDPEEAKDAMQDVFLSAFKSLAGFQSRSRFSTWLVSIARNAAIQRLRDRKNFESIEEQGGEVEQEFRPMQIRAWQDDPEQLYSAVERKHLVEKSILRLPAKYRVVLMLREVEQLSIERVAEDLGLSVPAAKARLLRGRLMLREALAPHFAAGAGRAAQ
jgi:RNA polymerase sigma-70 factor (ECF subfamily)